MRKLNAGTGGHRTAPDVLGQEIPHESAVKHVTGGALYVDDVAEPAELLPCTIRHSKIMSELPTIAVLYGGEYAAGCGVHV